MGECLGINVRVPDVHVQAINAPSRFVTFGSLESQAPAYLNITEESPGSSAAVPEPASLMLMTGGLLGGLAVRRRARHSSGL